MKREIMKKNIEIDRKHKLKVLLYQLNCIFDETEYSKWLKDNDSDVWQISDIVDSDEEDEYIDDGWNPLYFYGTEEAFLQFTLTFL